MHLVTVTCADGKHASSQHVSQSPEDSVIAIVVEALPVTVRGTPKHVTLADSPSSVVTDASIDVPHEASGRNGILVQNSGADTVHTSHSGASNCELVSTAVIA